MKSLFSCVVLITFLILVVGVNKHRVSATRRHTPLLIEDDGSRRNRPAGEDFLLLFSIFLFETILMVYVATVNMEELSFKGIMFCRA